jgi:hypothetical protein
MLGANLKNVRNAAEKRLSKRLRVRRRVDEGCPCCNLKAIDDCLPAPGIFSCPPFVVTTFAAPVFDLIPFFFERQYRFLRLTGL